MPVFPRGKFQGNIALAKWGGGYLWDKYKVGGYDSDHLPVAPPMGAAGNAMYRVALCYLIVFFTNCCLKLHKKGSDMSSVIDI